MYLKHSLSRHSRINIQLIHNIVGKNKQSSNHVEKNRAKQNLKQSELILMSVVPKNLQCLAALVSRCPRGRHE